MVHYFHYVLVSGSHFLCLGVACGAQGLGSSGDAAMFLFVRNAWLDRGCMFYVSSGGFFERIAHIFFGEVDSDPEVSRSRCCCRLEEECSADASVCSSALALLALGNLNIFL